MEVAVWQPGWQLDWIMRIYLSVVQWYIFISKNSSKTWNINTAYHFTHYNRWFIVRKRALQIVVVKTNSKQLIIFLNLGLASFSPQLAVLVFHSRLWNYNFENILQQAEEQNIVHNLMTVYSYDNFLSLKCFNYKKMLLQKFLPLNLVN